MIIYGGIDCERHILTLVYKSGEHKVSKRKECSTLTYVARIKVMFCHGHGSFSGSGLDIGQLNAYVLGKLIALIKKIFQCHIQL